MTTARLVSHQGRSQPYTLWVDDHVWGFYETKESAIETLEDELRRRVSTMSDTSAMAKAFSEARKARK